MTTNPIPARLEQLRNEMRKSGLSAVIIPQCDPHISEYLAAHWQFRRHMSGFTGSAGDLVVTLSEARLWTDSRYFLQAANQLEGSGIIMMKDGVPGTPSISSWLAENLLKGTTVGIDGMVYTIESVEALRKVLDGAGIKLDTKFDVADILWKDRPALPDCKIFVHDIKYAGIEAKVKIQNALNEVKKLAGAILISALDEIAWLLNIRSKDVNFNPVATAFLYLSPEGSVLFTNPAKVDEKVKQYLANQGVEVMAYGDMKKFLGSLPEAEKVGVVPARTAYEIKEILGGRYVAIDSPVAFAKGCKNDIQIAGVREAMKRDGVALVKAFMEIESRIADSVPTTELDIAEILHRHRAEGELFFDESFGTIAGYGPHGAIVHYEATPDTASTLKPEGLLLVDSGAQYLDGTTDITRTICLGMPTKQEKHDFTLVMKGHIALGMMEFPEDTRGAQLDAIARQFLWKEGLSYMHGTGHGVGHFLNVHEGPQSIRLNYVNAPLMPGMITSNEPGLYRENIHGIRCENLVVCKVKEITEFGKFLCFETLTLFPFELSLFETEIMTAEEIEWLNGYHAMVYEKLCPALDETQREWLALKTKPLKK